MLWTASFWKGLAERGIKTFFQSGVAAVGVQATMIHDVNWTATLSIAGLATILSVATSIGNANFTSGLTTPAKITK